MNQTFEHIKKLSKDLGFTSHIEVSINIAVQSGWDDALYYLTLKHLESGSYIIKLIEPGTLNLTILSGFYELKDIIDKRGDVNNKLEKMVEEHNK